MYIVHKIQNVHEYIKECTCNNTTSALSTYYMYIKPNMYMNTLKYVHKSLQVH